MHSRRAKTGAGQAAGSSISEIETPSRGANPLACVLGGTAGGPTGGRPVGGGGKVGSIASELTPVQLNNVWPKAAVVAKVQEAMASLNIVSLVFIDC